MLQWEEPHLLKFRPLLKLSVSLHIHVGFSDPGAALGSRLNLSERAPSGIFPSLASNKAIIDSWAIHSSLHKMSEEVKQSNYGVTSTLPSAEQGSACRLSLTVSLTRVSLEKTGHFIIGQHSLY